MIVHQFITWIYWAIIGFFSFFLVIKIVRSKEFDRQLLAAFVLIPFLLRLLLIK
jgi:hypothetical protein